MIKFLWVPDSPEHEKAGIEEMKPNVPMRYTSEKFKGLRDGVMDFSAKHEGLAGTLALKTLPAVDTLNAEFFWAKPRLVGKNYICGLIIRPGHLEMTFKTFAMIVDPNIFMPMIGFEYGRVRFLR